MEVVDLRPHHLLDIVASFRPDDDPDYTRAPGENGVRDVTRMLTRGLDFRVRLVIGPDCICAPCSHLQPDGHCDRILGGHDPPQPMDEYNDPLDARILGYLGIDEGSEMAVREFLGKIDERLPGIEQVCTHPTGEQSERLAGLLEGMAALGIRQP